ncbi:D-arabinono-1,4-lactone oxidase [Thermoleophilum album]|uniref:L-gulonolactone oxidase n=1 Tax=Thermoleophilum album TaxID=29539 RepID=A0A1H6FSG2_THEAL|nr:D-arabinono-1,4-lactone oxidase [Thermoleophilum album]SEH13837.1 L-gulonolactone oxidase [Thermoleophilum album]
MLPTWRNWSRLVSARPAALLEPRAEEEVARVVAAAQSIKAVGRGHSFTAIAETSGVALDLRRMRRVVAIEGDVATCEAGITIGELARRLAAVGLALANQGDIDRQTVAGAIATGTHGTGARFHSLSQQVAALRLVDAAGRVRTIAGGEDLLAARVGLGALGVVTRVSFRCVPLFGLRRIEEPIDRQRVLSAFDAFADSADHFEIFALPYARRCLVLRADRTAPPRGTHLSRARKLASDLLLANGLFGLHCRAARRWPRAVPRLNRLLAGGFGRAQHHDVAYRIYAHPRLVRFNEMEYALPRAAGPEAVQRVLELIERRRLPICFPIEVRVSAAEEALLSPAHQRDTTWIAVHQYAPMAHEDFFRAVEEEVMRPLGGRPHWGKLHYREANELAQLYPGWTRFQALRARFDPTGKFENAYLRRVLGPVRAGGDDGR